MKQKFENRYMCKCEICNHQWLSRNDEVPRRCANVDCQSFKWDRGEILHKTEPEPKQNFEEGEEEEEDERKYIFDPTAEHEIEARRILERADQIERERIERLKVDKVSKEKIKKLKSLSKEARKKGDIELANRAEQKLKEMGE